MSIYAVLAVWFGLALLASLVSIRVGLSVALVEIAVGAVAGNIPGSGRVVLQTDYTVLLGSLGSIILTFLAGAEIDPVSLARHWKSSLAIGFVSFAAPFAGAWAFAYWVLAWPLHASEIAGVSLSTTSVAVVYAVMIETGLSQTDLGKNILAACFVTDLGTVLALGGLFADFGWMMLVFAAVTAAVLVLLPRFLPWFLRTMHGRMSEPEVKVLLLVLMGLGALAAAADSEAVLPAYLVGLVAAGAFHHDRVLMDRVRSIGFAVFTPFFFLRAGLLISGAALLSGAGTIAALFGVKMVTKLLGVWPTAAAFHMPRRERNYTTLLMATGLTFGSISALFGLNHHLITQAQYSQLVTVVLLSAILPTLVAQRFFQPTAHIELDEEEALEAEDLVPHVRPAAGSRAV